MKKEIEETVYMYKRCIQTEIQMSLLQTNTKLGWEEDCSNISEIPDCVAFLPCHLSCPGWIIH